MYPVILQSVRSLAITCFRTAENVRGPFYRAGAPFRERRLCLPSEPGVPLTLAGRVTGLPACTPLPDAILDVWHASANGFYSNMLGLGRAANPQTFRFRGRFRTNAAGQYIIETILPGHYPWPFVRAKHIHFIITCPHYATLTTQIFFEGDTRLACDPWIKPTLIIPLREQTRPDGSLSWSGTFDVVLEQESNLV
jgi:protocatechuate 3,4-dioxygenase beta subunit